VDQVIYRKVDAWKLCAIIARFPKIVWSGFCRSTRGSNTLGAI